jgi:hypothetical protein
MIPYSPDFHAACPKQWRLVASLGLPHDSTGGMDNARGQLVTIQVAITEVGPGGFSVLYFSYTLERAESSWKVVGHRLVHWVE